MRNARASTALLLIGVLLAIGAAAPTSAAEKKILRLGHGQSATSQFQLAAQKFAEGVAKRTNGMLEVQVFPGGQLGNQVELVQGVKVGTIDLITVSGEFQSLLPATAAFDLPFLYRNREHAFRVYESEFGRAIYDRLLREHGIRTLNSMESGFRNLTTGKKPVNTLADIKGMKIRVPPDRVYLRTFQALGANPTSIVFTELFNALQQGVADGQENPLDLIFSAKLYEAQKYLALTRHVFSVLHIHMNEGVFKGLSPDYQKAIVDAAKEAETWERAYMVTREEDLQKKLREVGMTFNQPTDMDKWAEAVQPVVKAFSTEWGLPDWLEKVNSLK